MGTNSDGLFDVCAAPTASELWPLAPFYFAVTRYACGREAYMVDDRYTYKFDDSRPPPSLTFCAILDDGAKVAAITTLGDNLSVSATAAAAAAAGVAG